MSTGGSPFARVMWMAVNFDKKAPEEVISAGGDTSAYQWDQRGGFLESGEATTKPQVPQFPAFSAATCGPAFSATTCGW